MKLRLLPILSAVVLLASCSAAYRTGQTPDDVYFSADPAVDAELALARSTDNGQPRYAENDGPYQNYFDNDDAYLRMKVKNGGRWNSLDDQDYWYGYSPSCNCNNNWGYFNSFNSFNNFNNPWMFNSLAFGNYYSPYSFYSFYSPWSFNNWYNTGYYGYHGMGFYGNGYYGNGYYNPGNIIVIGSKNPVRNTSRPALSGYSNNQYDRSGSNRNRNSNQYRSGLNNNNSNSTIERPTRTFDVTPSTNSGSSFGTGSSGGGSSRSTGSGGSGRGGRGG